MAQYIVATTKTWNIENAKTLISRYPNDVFYLITEKEELTVEMLEKVRPRYIFFPHWSWIIPQEIFENYECVVFHMTDLPFGRGGSPLQNLLVRGVYSTKISAIKVDKGVDTGDVFLKEEIDISEGNADKILSNISDIVFEKMIPRFLEEQLTAVPQTGEVVSFKRRTPQQSEIPSGLSQRQLYDYIRMLDGEGYPRAYADFGEYRACFYNAYMKDGKVFSEVEMIRRDI